ncbi:nickel-type superoxide dismutase maturation protease [Streptomyces sp. BI20]|uniref:nickel-type superoxide dismutase maturation protease n=1 Tax=Streptomyces sp. BI20 TaxID=3403460 RepID=UPI003C76F16B
MDEVVLREPGPRRLWGAWGLLGVVGPSMAPTLAHGDLLLVRTGGRVRPGAVIVFRHPLRQDLAVVKRVVERRPGGWWVLGDNPFNESGDSLDYGPVAEELVLGVARVRLRDPGAQASLRARLRGLASAVRVLGADPAASARLRAR